jgi:hypothetical protein
MSTDYAAICRPCRQAVHLGVRFTSGWAFGHGTGDTQEQRAVGEWIQEHARHEPVIAESEFVPDGYEYIVSAEEEAKRHG